MVDNRSKTTVLFVIVPKITQWGERCWRVITSATHEIHFELTWSPVKPHIKIHTKLLMPHWVSQIHRRMSAKTPSVCYSLLLRGVKSQPTGKPFGIHGQTSRNKARQNKRTSRWQSWARGVLWVHWHAEAQNMLSPIAKVAKIRYGLIAQELPSAMVGWRTLQQQ